jgi:hypothetical protein
MCYRVINLTKFKSAVCNVSGFLHWDTGVHVVYIQGG